jgi:DNA-directed RNA polymerase subunit RPC12/RpoP
MGRFLILRGISSRMQSVRKGLRSGDLEKDTYERLTCSDCGEELDTQNDPAEVGRVRVCPGCGREWKEVG